MTKKTYYHITIIGSWGYDVIIKNTLKEVKEYIKELEKTKQENLLKDCNDDIDDTSILSIVKGKLVRL
jgi:hypothetical protein